MQNYISESGRLFGATGYEIGDDYIIIQFYGGRICKYSYRSAGPKVVEAMKKLAISQSGLMSYISRARPVYESKS